MCWHTNAFEKRNLYIVISGTRGFFDYQRKSISDVPVIHENHSGCVGIYCHMNVSRDAFCMSSVAARRYVPSALAEEYSMSP